MTMAESCGLVAIISESAPMVMIALRSAIEAVEPKVALICVVSAVNRETRSPARLESKKAGSSRVRWAKTSARRSATMRSPTVITR